MRLGKERAVVEIMTSVPEASSPNTKFGGENLQATPFGNPEHWKLMAEISEICAAMEGFTWTFSAKMSLPPAAMNVAVLPRCGRAGRETEIVMSVLLPVKDTVRGLPV